MTAPVFDGDDYDVERDTPRLSAQLERVWDVMKDGDRFTLDEIAAVTGDPPASISAQMRHLRKDRFGCHQIYKEYIENGLYEYWLIQNPKHPYPTPVTSADAKFKRPSPSAAIERLRQNCPATTDVGRRGWMAALTALENELSGVPPN